MNTPLDKSNTTLHTVIIQTSQMEKLAAFYGGGLELGEPAPTGGDHLGFQLPNAYFGFDNVEEPPEQSGVISLWFEVDDLEAALVGKELIGEISSPSEGVRVAMIIDDGAPVELLEFFKIIR